jgi:hypothetical protein
LLKKVADTTLGKNPDNKKRDEFMILEELICSITKEESGG